MDDLRAMGNLCRYHDIKYDTNLHSQFTEWLKKKEIKWTQKSIKNRYQISNRISINDVLVNLNKLPMKYKTFGLFVLVSGLRTTEAMEASNNHHKLCNDGIMEMFWDRKTKKTNSVYCHPLLHDKISFSVSLKSIYRNLNSKNLGCELRYLRKLNFTMVATKIDPLLAEFMQGRCGNVSQRHYFLPLMQNNKKKWEKVWCKILMNILD